MISPMYVSRMTLIFACLAMIFGAPMAHAQTDPAAQSLPFSFTSLSGSTLPAGMAVHKFAAEPASRLLTAGTADATYNSGSTSGGWRDEAANGISMLASGTQANGAFIVAVNTTGKEDILVSWIARTILQQASRDETIALQYRLGTSGDFTDVASTDYTSQGKTVPDSQTFTNVALPAACDNQSVVQLRWIYWLSNGSSGSRDRLGIDDISVTGTDIATADDPNIAAPAALAFGSIANNTTSDMDVTTTNTGASVNLNILSTFINGSGASKFSVQGSLPTGIAPGSHGNITVRFNPGGQNGAFSASLGIQSNDTSDAWTTVTLTGVGTPPPSPLIISGILADCPESPENWEFIELYNTSGSPIDISGYVVDDNNGTAHVSANIASGIVPANGVAYLFNGDALTDTQFKLAWGNVNAIPVTGWAAMALNNGGDTIGLWDNFATYSGDHALHNFTVENLAYQDALNGWPDVTGVEAIYLTNVSADNSVGANWAAAVSGDLGNTTATGGKVMKSNNAGGNLGTSYASVVAAPPSGAPVVADVFTSHTGSLIVTFNQNVELTTAQTAGNYQLSDGAATSNFATAVRDASDNKVVYLLGPTNTALFDDTTSDILTVNNVQPDGGGAPASNATSAGFYAGVLSIATIQQNTLYPNAKITVRGVVSADDEFNQVWIADGAGAWNGVVVHDASQSLKNLVDVGDDIVLVGTTLEYFGLTEFASSSVHKKYSAGNAPYAAATVTAADLEFDIASDTAPAEQYEGVLVKILNAAVVSTTDGNYEFRVSDDSGVNETVVDDDAWFHYGSNTYAPTAVYNVTGVVTFSFSHYKVCPRSAADMDLVSAAGVEDWLLY